MDSRLGFRAFLASVGISLTVAAAMAGGPAADHDRPVAPSGAVVDGAVIPVSVPPHESSPLPVVVEASRHFARIAHLASPSLVHIQSRRPGRNGGTIEETGSGVLMRSVGTDEVFAVTNQHVVGGAKLSDIEIKLYDGRIVRPYDRLEDLDTDIAVLKLRADGLQPAVWGDSDALDIGHMVLAMGSPFGLSKSITFGIISAKGRRSLNLGSSREVLNQDFLQTDAAINPGNSGGPLIDMYGRVVGINTAIASSSGGNEGIGFSIPSNLVQQVVRQLMTSGRVQRAYLGVRLDEDFNAEKARKYSLDRSRGARVVQVLPGSPAAAAGLQTDDIILSFDGQEIEDESHLIHLVSLSEVNRTVRLQILRNGRRETVMVRLIDRTQLDAQSSLPAQRRLTPPEIPARNVGLTLHRVDHQLAPQLGLGQSAQGLVVLSLPGGQADENGLRLYDCIIEVARTPVRSVEEFSAALSQSTDEGPLLLKVLRLEQGRPCVRLVLWTSPNRP